MKLNTLVQFFAARKMRIFSEFILAILSLFGTNFGTKNRLLGLFSIKSGNWELGLSKKWMKRIILVQFFPARKMRIFSESVCAILSPFWTQFWYQTQVFGPIFNKKWKLGNGLSKKWMKHNILVQFSAIRTMRIISKFIWAFLILVGTNFGTNNRILVLFSIKSGNCELV